MSPTRPGGATGREGCEKVIGGEGGTPYRQKKGRLGSGPLPIKGNVAEPVGEVSEIMEGWTELVSRDREG